jgi:hypothetical protein
MTVLETLKVAGGPMTLKQLAETLKVEVDDVRRELREMTATVEVETVSLHGHVHYKPTGWVYAEPDDKAHGGKGSDNKEAPSKFTGTWNQRIVAVLQESGRPMSSREIAAVLGEENPNRCVSPTLAVLVKQGAIRRDGQYGSYTWRLPTEQEQAAPRAEPAGDQAAPAERQVEAVAENIAVQAIEPAVPAVEAVEPATQDSSPKRADIVVLAGSIAPVPELVPSSHSQLHAEVVNELSQMIEQRDKQIAGYRVDIDAAQKRVEEHAQANIKLAKELDEANARIERQRATIGQLQAKSSALSEVMRMSPLKRRAFGAALQEAGVVVMKG